MRARLIEGAAAAVLVVSLSGCGERPPSAPDLGGLTVSEAEQRIPADEPYVAYNVSPQLHLEADPYGSVDDPDEWIVLSACRGRTQVALAVVPLVSYRDELVDHEAARHRRLLTSEQCA